MKVDDVHPSLLCLRRILGTNGGAALSASALDSGKLSPVGCGKNVDAALATKARTVNHDVLARMKHPLASRITLVEHLAGTLHALDQLASLLLGDIALRADNLDTSLKRGGHEHGNEGWDYHEGCNQTDGLR